MESAQPPISPAAFQHLQTLFREASGIELKPGKQCLVASRLSKRLDQLGLPDFDAYCSYLGQSPDRSERQILIDLLTTNETYFFREKEHFAALARLANAMQDRGRLRVWSAACATGEEPYSIAMTLDDNLGPSGWEVVASDLCQRALETARRGLYRMQRLESLPQAYLRRYCLRGTGPHVGQILIDRALRNQIHFRAHNLLDDAAGMGRFDVIFLRNVLIYFDQESKGLILQRVIEQLAPGGWLYVGHSEALHGHELPLRREGKATYRRL